MIRHLPPHKPQAITTIPLRTSRHKCSYRFLVSMGCGSGAVNRRRPRLLGLFISVLAISATALNVASHSVPAANKAGSLASSLNNPESEMHLNLYERQQYSCPNPSTQQFCDPNYCFLMQNNADGSWGTCCPAGSSLILYGGGEDHWSSQKCCPSGSSVEQCKTEDISAPPMRPLQCGNGGIISGWSCVYASGSGSTSNFRSAAGRTSVLMAITGIIWLVQLN